MPDLPHAPAGKEGWPWVSEPQPERSKVEWPRITVVTPSFNQGEFVEAALRSVLLQAYPNLEYIVLDGGSTDGSAAIIERYAPHLEYWHSRKDDGQAAAVRSGFEMATGEILCWLNSDDILLPGSLRKVGEFFGNHPSVDFLYGNRLVIDREGEVIGQHVWPWLLTRSHWAIGQPVAQECCFWRKELYSRVGGINPNRFFILDYDLFFRMWRVGRFRKTSAFLGCIRQHEATKNTLQQDVRLREMAEARLLFSLKEPGYVMARVLNRIDRLQRLLDTRAIAPRRTS
jgi:glycosyltransferase involved in cell wall biosynthesis